MEINCPICKHPSTFFVAKNDRFNQEYRYMKCGGCRLVFDADLVLNKSALQAKTGKEYDDAYFKTVDSGWKMRGDKILKVINGFLRLRKFLRPKEELSVLDYGAGNGYVTAKIKHAKTYFYDTYEKPTHAGSYTIVDAPMQADVVCAVELVEHLTDLGELERLFSLSKSALIVTTEVSDGISDEALLHWEYINPNAGHTAIYTFKALGLVAKRRGFFYVFFPSKLTHIFIRNRFLSKFNVVGVEYVVYRAIRKLLR